MNTVGSTVRRLLPKLAPSGFRLGLSVPSAKESRLYASCDGNELFMLINIHFAGRKSDVVYTHMGVAVTRVVYVKGLIELEPIKELATDAERCWAVVDSTDALKLWERRLVDIAPRRARDLAARVGPVLLSRTNDARVLSRTILSKIDANEEWDPTVLELRQTNPREVTAIVERLVDFPGIIWYPRSHDAYRIACYHVLNALGEAGYEIGPINYKIIDDHKLIWPIQLVADELIVRAKEHGRIE